MNPTWNLQEVKGKCFQLFWMILRLLSITLIYFVGLTVGISAESQIRTIHGDAESLILEFKLSDLEYRKKEIEGRSYSEINFEGAKLTMEVGKPQLPTYSELIGIPLTALPHVTIIDSRTETRSIQEVMPAQPHPTLGSDDLQFSEGASFVINRESYRQNRLYPLHLVEVVPIGFVREQRIARLAIHPVQYNPQTSQLKIYHELQIRVDFHRQPAAPSHVRSPYRPSQPFEEFFQKRLLNYNQARAWRKLLPSQSQAPAAPSRLLGEERYKILIKETGMYRITYDNLHKVGVKMEEIDLETIKMEQKGRTVGVSVVDQAEDGRFDPGDWIAFYGHRLVGDKFTDTNAYWLSWNGSGASQVEIKNAAPKTPESLIPIAFMKTERFEENLLHDSLNGDDVRSELADHYFWTSLKNGDSKRFPIEFPGAIPRQLIHRLAKIRVKLQGASPFNHTAKLLFNGRQIGQAETWKRQASILLSHDIEQRRFIHHDATNSTTIVAEDSHNPSPNTVVFYVDWFELDYWHAFKAISGRLEFNSKTEPKSSGIVQYRIENLRSREVDVYQVRNESIVAKLVNGTVQGEESPNFELTFEDIVTQPSSYFVLDKHAYRRVDQIVPSGPSTLRNPSNQADYIVITHEEFFDSIQPLVQFRRSQGFSVVVADVGQVYDQFNHGIFSPFAIREFLRYAYTSWQQPGPAYVLLVGDAHYDYKSAIVELYRRDGVHYDLYPIYVPTFHGWAPLSGETAMDHRFVTVSGEDTLPDMFIGRLSVQSPRELDTMVAKLIDYEQNPRPGPWQARILQIADDEKSNSIDWLFEQSRIELIDDLIPRGYDTREVFLRRIASPERTKQLILKTIDAGVLVAEYSGHGGSETWADEGILRIENVSGLRNKNLPFIVTTTCLNGQFDKPLRFGDRSLSEEFMMGRHGAVGTLSATRLTFAIANAEFDKDLFHSIFTVKPSTLGAIIADAKTKFIATAMNSGRDSWIPGAEQYTLFGDPATRLALPELEIKVELDEIALNSNKEIVIRQNVVGSQQFLPRTGEIEFLKATNFSTDKMSASVSFANNFDEDQFNDLSRRQNNIDVWDGEFGDIHFQVPRSATAGRGIIRLFASDGQYIAVGGTEFWTDQPVILNVRENLDAKVSDTLSISAQIVDDAGPKGIKSVEAIWSTTVDSEMHILPMVLDPQPPGPHINGGAWWKTQMPIPLPRGGRSVFYQVVVTDSTNRVTFFPGEKDRKSVKVPEGANIAIAPNMSNVIPLRYGYSGDASVPILKVDLINNGGKNIPVDVEIWFSESNLDMDGNRLTHMQPEFLGSSLVRVDDWKPGDMFLQKVTATLALAEPLSRGAHKIYVYADPESPHHNPDDRIIGALDESKSGDNDGFFSLIVNEFALKPIEQITIFSLDRVFDATFPAGSSEATILSVDSIEPPRSFQPDLELVPIPQVAVRWSGLSNNGREEARAYTIKLHSGMTQLAKPAEIKLRFDAALWTEKSVSQKKDEKRLSGQTNTMAVYTWQEHMRAWKQLPSRVLRQGDGDLLRERFVTPTQTGNSNPQKLRVSDIRVDPTLTPIGEWALLFVDSDRYEVLLRRGSGVPIYKIEELGEVGKVLRDEVVGIEMQVEQTTSSENGEPFTFGDLLMFETNLNRSGNVTVSDTRDRNRGNGFANVEIKVGSEVESHDEDWLILFRDRHKFEIRDSSNMPVMDSNGTIVLGSVENALFLRSLGVEVAVTAGDAPFAFGDKIKFSISTVGAISAEAIELSAFALMENADIDLPKVKLWVNGETPQPRGVIPPRPEISLLMEDSNGVDMSSFRFAVSKNEGPFEEITEYELTNEGQVKTIPIVYEPILFIGRYLYRIWVKDLNGNELGGPGGFSEFLFFVEEEPDLEAPRVETFINGDRFFDGAIVNKQPEIEIQITDSHGIDPTSIFLSFGRADESLSLLSREEFDLEYSEIESKQATISFAPNLPNSPYQIQISASDTSKNVYEGAIFNFQIDESVDIIDVLNVPNPMRTNTYFTYNLVQAPESVTIKIYTLTGRLLRTISDASAMRGYNETYWDARDENSVRLANGTYLYKIIIDAENRQITRIGRLAILR